MLNTTIVLAFVLGSIAVTAASAQTNPPAPDKGAMDRALQQADGPKRRILEAAKLKAGTRAPAPPAAVAAAAPPAAAAASAAAPRARAEAAPPSSPIVVVGTLQAGVEPVVLPPSGSVPTVATVAPAEAMASPATMVAMPPPAATPAALSPAAAPALPPPRLLSKVDPEWPARLFRRGNARSEVVVQLVINTDGSVREVELKSATSPELGPPVIEAVRQWQYEAQAVPRPHQVRLVISPS